MARASRRIAAALDNADDEGESSGRRSTRSRQQTVFFSEDKGKDNADEDDTNENDSEEENPSSEEDSEDEEEEEEESIPVRRKSSRSTAFRGGMKDPSNSIADLLKNDAQYSPAQAKKSRRAARHKKRSSLEASVESDDDNDDDDDDDSSVDVPRKKRSSKSVIKSPAKRHTKRRMTKKLEYAESESSEESDSEIDDDDDDEEEEEGEEMKFNKIIAAQSMTLGEWEKKCSKINTTEITNGSRWIQEKTDRDPDKYEERFLVKWEGLSFLHCSWETEKDLIEFCEQAKTKMSTFFRKAENGLLYDADERLDGDYFDPSWTTIERILEVVDDEFEEVDSDDPIKKYNIILDVNHPDFEEGTGRQFHVKWVNKPYSESNYEFERDLILNDVEYLDELAAYERRSVKPSKSEMQKLDKKADTEKKKLYTIFGEKFTMSSEKKEEAVQKYQKELENHTFENGGQLRDYQAEGVSWLMANHVNKRSSILADEMGLGKTIQTATYVNQVAKQLHTRGPFLIIAPLSTIPHWYREFTGWTDLNTIVYHGSANDRERAREDEFAFPEDRVQASNVGLRQRYLSKVAKRWRSKWEKTWMVEVVITTPEMLVTEDFRELAAIEWEILVVDEAHRLKNHKSKLAVNLRDGNFDFKHSLLLTGTPIQNNMEELWTLLNFIDDKSFDDLDEFMDKYGDIKSKERVDELHESIRPYILRRLKEDVEKSVPPKEETLIEVELTVVQKQYYRALYEKNLKFLHKNKKGGVDGPSLNNLAMQLRKCCNHPFLLNGIEEEIRNQQPNVDIADLMVNTSGKFVLLDKLLPRLKEEGHRILIFSQFKIMLDIIEDYLHHREFKCERIDGSITGLKRQAAIDRFQSKDSKGNDEPFIMLLSTRAGGVGINLTAADTCIIFDSDWNPQNDLQAQARCHRIGQTKEVKIYRLLTRKTYEMQMFHMSSMKMGLDQAVLQGIEGGGDKEIMTKEEVERLLKHGAYDIFNEDKDGTSEKESTEFVSQDIDSILARRAKTVVHENTGSKSSAAGGTFSKASFKSTNDGGVDAAEIDVDDPDFWTKVVGEVKEEVNEDDVAGKKRKRSEKSYNENEYHKKLNAVFKGIGDAASSDDDGDDNVSVASEYSDSGDETLGSALSEDLKTIVKATKSHKKEERHKWGGSGPKEWKNTDAEHVLRALHAFGYGNISWEKFQAFLTPKLSKPMQLEEIKRMSWALALICLQEAAEDDALEKKRKVEDLTKENQTAGGVLGQAAGVTEGQNEEKGDAAQNGEVKSPNESNNKNLPQESFEAFLSENESWIMKTLADALAYSKAATSRDKDWVQSVIDGTSGHKKDKKENPVQLKLSSEFNENVWPALRTRGWKEESDKSGKKGYTYKGKTVKSISAVLDVVPRFHPELAKMVSSLLSSVAATCKESEDPHPASSMDIDKMTLKSLKLFLLDCAPLQLLADRKTGNRLTLNKRTLTQLKYCHSLHAMISSADSNLPSEASIEERNNMLAKLIKINPKVGRPHPEWTALHDAILIRASAKHGWPDKSTSAMAIANDKDIRWGAPFEATEKAKTEEKQDEFDKEAESKFQEEFDQLYNVASRAAAFLKPLSATFSDCIPAADLNEISERLITSYALDAADEDSSDAPDWKVKEKRLKGLLKPKKNKKQDDCEELPPRKKLLKRARKLVLSFMGKDGGFEDDKDDAPSGNQDGDQVAPDHGFCVLDQADRNNILLVEMIRGNLKVKQGTKSQKMKDYTTLIFDEIDQRLKDLDNADGNDAQIEELKRIRRNIQLYFEHSRKSPRAAKNVLRVMLGKDPVHPKAATDTVFPVEKIEKTEKDEQAAQTKQKKKKFFTPADAALNRALASLKDDNEDGIAECLLLTSTEILMLTVLSSQGIPVFNTKNWASLVSNELTTIEDDFHIYFFAMAGVMEAAADVWLKIAERKLQSKVEIFKNSQDMSENAKNKLTHEISVLEKDRDAKQLSKGEAATYSNDPLMFAKRVIMLLEALRKQMGPVDLQYVGEKKIRALNKSENGLGTKVIHWMSKEMQRWAEPFEILDSAGNVRSKTSITPAKDHSQSYDAAIMTKRDCRTVFIQIAQQTRLRSIFIKNDILRLQTDLVPKVLKQSSFMSTEWEDRPSWWNNVRGESNCTCQDDLDLLVGILDYGYGGFGSMLDQDYSFCSQLNEGPEEELKAFTRAAVQSRINHLTRELHALDDSEEMMKLVSKKQAKRKSGEVQVSNANGPTKKKKSGGIQSGLKAFFKQSSSAPSKKQKTPPTSPEPAQDESDVEFVAVKKPKC